MYFLSKHFQTKHLSCSLQQYIYSVIWVFFFAFAFFFNPKDRNFLILHYLFSFSKLFNLFTEGYYHQIFFSFQFQFVSFIHAAFRIWKNNSFTTELCIAEAFKYRALDRSIFSYLNLPYFSIFTLFFVWENGKSFIVFLSSPDIFSVWYFFANFWKSTMNLSKKFSS